MLEIIVVVKGGMVTEIYADEGSNQDGINCKVLDRDLEEREFRSNEDEIAYYNLCARVEDPELTKIY